MALVRFDQDPAGPPGAGTYHSDTGQSQYLFLPQMAGQLPPSDAAVPQPDPSMIQGGPHGGPDLRLADNSPMPQVGQGGWASQAADFQLPPPPGAPTPEPPAAIRRPPEAPPPTPQQLAAQGQQNEEANTHAVIRSLALGPRTGPTRGGFAPRSRSESFEGEGDPQVLAQDQAIRTRDAQAETNAHLATVNAQTERAKAEAEGYAAAQPALVAQRAKAQGQFDQAQAAYQQERAHLDQLVEATNQQTIDPNHWYRKVGVFGGIAAAVAQAVGAYAATLGRTENFAGKVIDDAINRDIAAQRAEIEQGHGRVNNALRRLQVHYGDLGQAQDALKIIQTNVANNEMLRQASMTKSQDAMLSAQEWVAGRQSQLDKDNQSFRDKAIGKHTTKIESAYQAPSAGGQAGISPDKLKKLADVFGEEAVGKALGIQLAGGGDDKFNEQTRNLVKDSADIVKAQAEAQPGRDLIQKYKGQEGIPGLGYIADAKKAFLGPRLGLSDEERRNRAIIQRTVLAYQHALTGAGASDNERKMLTDGILGSKTAEELSDALEQADAALAARRKSIESGYPRKVVETVNRRGVYHPNELPETEGQVGR